MHAVSPQIPDHDLIQRCRKLITAPRLHLSSLNTLYPVYRLPIPIHHPTSQSCEDYRAAATIDLDHDRESRSNGQKLAISDLRVLWGKQGIIERMSKDGDAVDVWKSYSSDKTTVSGRAVDCGHYIPEEAPEELLAEIEEFLA